LFRSGKYSDLLFTQKSGDPRKGCSLKMEVKESETMARREYNKEFKQEAFELSYR
jgi:hypothetical protein